jgi:hypothetical protein
LRPEQHLQQIWDLRNNFFGIIGVERFKHPDLLELDQQKQGLHVI